MKKLFIFFFKSLCCFSFAPLFGSMKVFDEKPSPERIKNFSLAQSQQLSPLVSFGQTILDKGVFQVYSYSAGYLGPNTYLTYVNPYLVYGVRDDLSLSVYMPFSPKNADGGTHSSGIQDIFAQGEYAFYAGEGTYYEDQATLVAQIVFPTGSTSKDPPTGAGSMSYFLGATLDRMTYNWLFFVSPGAELTTSHNGTKLGDQIYYQCGIGRYIPSPSGWIFAALIEFDGEYAWKNKIKGIKDLDSGGNVIYLTPSFWFSSKRIILQAGAGYPIVQHLFGTQSKQCFSINFSLGMSL